MKRAGKSFALAAALVSAAISWLVCIDIAHADTVTLDGSYSVQYTPNQVQVIHNGHTYTVNQGNSPSFVYGSSHNSLLDKSFSEPGLSQGTAVSTDFFQIDPNSQCGSYCSQYNNTAKGTIAVTFSDLSLTSSDGTIFTLVQPANLTADGTYQAKYSGSVLSCASSDPASTHGQSDCINWTTNDPIDLSFQSGDLIDTVSITLLDAFDWNITPQISFEWTGTTLTTHQGNTPLPGALPLFTSGLSSLGLFGWWRKRRKGVERAGA